MIIKNEKLSIIHFSPNGTTKQILDAIVDGLNYTKTEQIDLIKKDKIKKQKFTNNDLVLIGAPVYSGRIPLMVVNRLQNFKATNTKAILVVVYGNRHYDDALLELKDLVVELGFYPIAAAAYIGTHSFSSLKYQIAEGRPNTDDLRLAKDFGKQAMINLKDHKEINVPGTYPYKERSEKLKVKPKIDMDLCDFCGLCREACPVDAISIFTDRIDIDENLCIYCHACVKICPQNARIIDDERIIKSAKNLYEKCKQLQIPEIFLQKSEPQNSQRNTKKKILA